MSTETDLTALLSKTSCYCLNESSPQQFNHLFAGDHTLTLKSDADEQLLLHLAFNQTVSLRRIQFGVPCDETCPNTVKLFVNKNNLDFPGASDTQPTQVVTLTPASSATGGQVSFNLNIPKWQRTDSITIFVEDNHGAEISSLFSVKLFGVTLQGFDVSTIHSQSHSHE
eukprot:gene11022-12267_t